MNEFSDRRVMIVDDTKFNVKRLVMALRDEYVLDIATDGESALEKAEATPPDLILLDIVMPGIDGYEVCRRLRASEKNKETPIMFLSSLEDVEDKAKGFELGANDYLTKPFADMEVQARVRSLIKAKIYAEAVRHALDAELKAARDIQMGILPSDLKAFTKGCDLEISATIEPAKQVGGDLYDVLRVGDRVAVIIGDVSGKGVPAAMFMTVTVTLARSMARQFATPGEILRRLNAELVAQNPLCMFVSIICLIFDLKTGWVFCANAGHNPPVFTGADGKPRFVFSSTGKIAGIDEDLGIKTETLSLEPGDSLVLYTDGVTEAFDEQKRMFDNDGLLKCLKGANSRSAAQTVSRLREAVDKHAAGTPQSDDIAIVAIRRKGDR